MASAVVLSTALPHELLANPRDPSHSKFSALMPFILEARGSNLSLPLSYSPDRRFGINASIGSGLLPINSALMNVLHFMGIVAMQDFMSQLSPRKYSAPGYRDVDIANFAWTEARFLLWGVYAGVHEMLATARFNDILLELLWEKQMVGRIKIARKQTLSVSGAGGTLIQSTGDVPALMNLTDSSEESTEPMPVFHNVTDDDSISLSVSSINTTVPSNPPAFAVSFESFSGARSVKRNDLFMTFYDALLQAAESPSQSRMVQFESESPDKKMHLYMKDVDGCTFEDVINALVYVPKFMMEHRGFGYRETNFLVMLQGKTGCMGTIIRDSQSVERRTLAQSRAM